MRYKVTYIEQAFLALWLACAPAAEWPPLSAADVEGEYYFLKSGADGASVVAVSAAAGARTLGLAADPGSALIVAPDGRCLYYGRASALRRYEIRTGREEVVASFPAGVAREVRGETGAGAQVSSWDCGVHFPEVAVSPAGEVAFRVLPFAKPLPDRPLADFAADERAAWARRDAFQTQAGIYVARPGENATYVMPSRRLYGFAPDGSLLTEDKLTVVKVDPKTGAATRIVAPDAHEAGWLPAAVVSPQGETIVVGAKARERSFVDIMNRIYVIKGHKGRERPFVEIKDRKPATRAALSADGRYLAVEATPQVYGPGTIYVVDLKTRRWRPVVEGGRLVGFGAGSRAVVYLAGAGVSGDIYLAGLDGTTRRLTAGGDILPPP